MALDKLTQITSSGINSTTPLNGISVSGIVTGGSATFDSVDVLGVLTYDDVTNIDALGIVTARSGIHVTGGKVGIGTDDPSQKLSIGSASDYLQSHGIGVYNPHSLGLRNGVLVYNNTGYSNAGSYKAAALKTVGVSGNALGISTDANTNGLSGTLNAYIKFDGSAYFGSDVGIGTDNPSNLLDILQDTGRTRLNQYGHIISQNHNHGTTNYWALAPRDGGELNIAYGTPNGNGNVAGEIVTIDVDGNVSIGTDNPTGTNPARLTVLSDPSTAVSYGSSDAFAVKSKNINGTGISTIFAIRPFSPSGPLSAVGNNPLYNVAINAWVQIDSVGHRCNFLADDVQRTYVGFYTGASVDQLKAGEYSTLNGDGEPTAFGLANILYNKTNGLSFNRGAGASADVSFRFVGKSTHGDDNKILRFAGNTHHLDVVNHASGDYSFYNTSQGNQVRIMDGSGGVELRYNSDATKTLECDSGGVVSPYIYNSTSSNTNNYVRINGSYGLQRVGSSRRYKNNIGVYTGGLSRISTIVPRVWNDHKDGERVVGIVAEELHESGYTDAVSYSSWFGGSEVGIGDDPSPMVGNGSTPVTKTGEELDDGVEVVDGISDRAIICDLVLAVQELTSRISALESN